MQRGVIKAFEPLGVAVVLLGDVDDNWPGGLRATDQCRTLPDIHGGGSGKRLGEPMTQPEMVSPKRRRQVFWGHLIASRKVPERLLVGLVV